MTEEKAKQSADTPVDERQDFESVEESGEELG